MKRGDILAAVRQDNRTSIIAVLVLSGILGSVMALNWRYLYNWARGPFPFDAALAAAPGNREFVRAEGLLIPTGMAQETTVRLFRGAVENKSVSATYMAMLTGDRLLIVKVPPEFSGRVVEGRLQPLPEALRGQLEGDAAAKDKPGRAFYPYLLEQRGYGWLDSNLFVLVGAPLFLLSLPFAAWVVWSSARIERHASMRRLARLGPLDAMIARVETAIAAAGRSAKAGPLWITPQWLVALSTRVLVFPASDLAGVGLATAVSKSGETQHTLHVWVRGSLMEDTLDLTASEANTVMQTLAHAMPWAVVEDVKVFDKRWTADREACTRDLDERRKTKGAALGGAER